MNGPDIVKAVRTGERPDGRELAPVMPWRAYAAYQLTKTRWLSRPTSRACRQSAHTGRLATTGPEEKPAAPYLGVFMP